MYILNDYSLSPVFNIRGVKELTPETEFKIPIGGIELSKINIQEDGIIEETAGLENARGIFKISHARSIQNGTKNVFDSTGINPIGIKIEFNRDVVTNELVGLPVFTKGFFIVRQPRIPTILAQGVGISTTKHGHLPTIKTDNKYIVESFLSHDAKKKPFLKNSLYTLTVNQVVNNALICPEASIRPEVYNTYFNSSEYNLAKSKYQPTNRYFNKKLFIVANI